MANRDEILRELIVEEIRCAIENGTINIKDLLRYDQDFVFSDPRDIPSLGYVESLIGTGGSTIVYRTFLIPSSDITDGSVNITGRTNEQGDTVIPSDANVSVYEGGKIVPATYYENGLIEGLDGSLDVKVVLIGIEPVEPTGIPFTNNYNNTIYYQIPGGDFETITAGQTILLNELPQTIIFQAATEPEFVIGFTNQDNAYLENTDGTFMIETTPHTWNIPAGSTLLKILQLA